MARYGSADEQELHSPKPPSPADDPSKPPGTRRREAVRGRPTAEQQRNPGLEHGARWLRAYGWLSVIAAIIVIAAVIVVSVMLAS